MSDNVARPPTSKRLIRKIISLEEGKKVILIEIKEGTLIYK